MAIKKYIHLNHDKFYPTLNIVLFNPFNIIEKIYL